MNQVRHATLELLDLPVETLVYIFNHLDGYELARARRVCHNIRHMIDSSSELLYPIDLKYFNSIPVPSPGPDHTVASLRESLRQSEFAWQKAKYFKSNPVSIPYTYITDDVFMWSGGILALDPQVTDPDHSTSLREWDYHFDGEFPLCDFSPIQDLLICLVKASPGSLSEPDEVHPEAGSAVVKTIDEEVDFESLDPSSTVSFSIFGHYCGILSRKVFNAHGDLVESLQIWNWKSKDVSLCLKPAHEILHFSFLTNETILVVNSEELLLYSLVDFPDALHLTAKFSLPALRTSCRYEEIRIKDSISSHSRMHDHIININMKILGDHSVFSSCVALYVERNTLLELQSTYTRQYGKASDSSPNLPWSEWGLKYTRSFRGDLLDTCKNVVFGLRAVSFVGSQIRPPLPRALCIRDFNPHRVADFKAGNGIRWNQRLIEGNLLDSGADMFLEPLGSGLPYIETITEEEFLGVDLIAEGNKVMVLSFDFVGRLDKSIEILNFE
ncbi:uncharacterized protein F5147DRAFT_803699 [Suillus discolor]|uniref:F-box domain-containing protein n=1 Tax=Suillus discolor TaxID=1912936 RepID=A0A9P7F5S9_9AGAM|nr:uncharacterized protein F5147DRAFT_803699 [Suillus discolor]KAG2107022.1 hypothetical protein F5147DRAFT_803699 [Suillus discolor]